jgi:16S rRNA G966 N2-methylase RsmD
MKNRITDGSSTFGVGKSNPTTSNYIKLIFCKKTKKSGKCQSRFCTIDDTTKKCHLDMDSEQLEYFAYLLANDLINNKMESREILTGSFIPEFNMRNKIFRNPDEIILNTNELTSIIENGIYSNFKKNITLRDYLNMEDEYVFSKNDYAILEKTNIDEFKKKKYIQNMLTYYETVKNKNKTKNEYVVLKEVYNICISAINIIRPLVYMEIYSKYKPKTILDFCAGWGGASVAAAALNVNKYIGIEINHDLKKPYDNLVEFLQKKSKTNIHMIFENALNINYNELTYDFVFTSPPYYFIQKYENNTDYISKKEMDTKFYIPLFSKTYDGLQPGGTYIINVCKEVYENVLLQLFGEAHEVYPYKKSKRQNNYDEIVYVWFKPLNM